MSGQAILAPMAKGTPVPRQPKRVPLPMTPDISRGPQAHQAEVDGVAAVDDEDGVVPGGLPYRLSEAEGMDGIGGRLLGLVLALGERRRRCS